MAALAEGARALDESSDSDAEHEPGAPQKLIRKVSTSGQIRSKVRSRRSSAVISRRCEMRLRYNDRYFAPVRSVQAAEASGFPGC